ncbi:MAG: SDR family oxidoreductase [Candidatus Acidiferrales bacterium]
MAENSKVAFITGGTDGLGRATALLLAQENFRVFATGRNPQKISALNEEARAKNLPLEALEMDVTDDASVDQALRAVREKAGAIEVLVNSAGVAIVAVMEEITLADLRKQFETNFFGVVRVTQRVLPEMRERRSGRIINMSSVGGRMASPLFGPYSGSKFALEGMSDAMRVELAPFGVHVILIEPGFIPSGMNAAAAELSSAYASRAATSPYKEIYGGFLKKWKKATKAPRYTPEDCARVILRVVRAERPKARYPVTLPAYAVGIMRRVLSDRMVDRMMLRSLGVKLPRK